MAVRRSANSAGLKGKSVYFFSQFVLTIIRLKLFQKAHVTFKIKANVIYAVF